jgi:hypothetical protein
VTTITIPGRFLDRVRKQTKEQIAFGPTVEEYNRGRKGAIWVVPILCFVFAVALGLPLVLPVPEVTTPFTDNEMPATSVLIGVILVLLIFGISIVIYARPWRVITDIPADIIIDFQDQAFLFGNGKRLCKFDEAELAIHVMGKSIGQALYTAGIPVHENDQGWCLSVVDRSDQKENLFPQHLYLVGNGTLAEVQDLAVQLLRLCRFRRLAILVESIILSSGKNISTQLRINELLKASQSG